MLELETLWLYNIHSLKQLIRKYLLIYMTNTIRGRRDSDN